MKIENNVLKHYLKNVYFIQVGFAFDKSVYLPYATGTIVAYCKAQPDIAAEYNFPEIIFRRDNTDTIVNGMDNPYIAAFSTYVWNVEFNKALAKAVKERYIIRNDTGFTYLHDNAAAIGGWRNKWNKIKKFLKI